jgi:hypothetical protein
MAKFTDAQIVETLNKAGLKDMASTFTSNRAAQARGGAITDTSSNMNTTNETMLSTLQNRLLGAADVVSSSDTAIENAINSAIGGINKSQQKSAERLELAAGRESGYIIEGGKRVANATLEARRGFATSTGVMKQIYADTDKELKDLDMRKQELILQGESDAASQIAGLQMKALEYRQDATQRAFNNLLGLANLSTQIKTEERLGRAQNFAEQSAINSIALQFGLPIEEGDTLDSITSKAAPFASQKQQLEFAKLRAEINRANAETQKAMRNDNFQLDALTAGSLANTIYQMTARGETEQANALLANVLDKHGSRGLSMVKDQQYNIINNEFSEDNLRSSISNNYSQGETMGSIIDSINSNPFATPEQKQRAEKIAKELKPQTTSRFGNLLDIFSSRQQTNTEVNNRISSGFEELKKGGSDISSFTNLFKF